MAQLFKNIFNSNKEKQTAEVESVQSEDSQHKRQKKNAPEIEKSKARRTGCSLWRSSNQTL